MFNLPPDYDPRVSMLLKNRGSDVWYLMYYLPDGTRVNTSSGCKSKMLARAKAKVTERRLLDGEFTDQELERLGPAFGHRELTIDQALDRYLEVTAPNKSSKTKEKEAWDLRRHFAFFKESGATLLKDVSTSMVNDLLCKRYGAAAPATRRTVRVAVKKVFTALIREGTFNHVNPVERAQTVRLTKAQSQRDVWIPYAQHVKLVAAASEIVTPLQCFREMLELEWELALRRDEILTLEWFQVDVTNRLLRIVNKPEFPTRFGRGWSPKWRKERTMPLTEKAVEILGRIPRRRTFARLGKGKAAELIPVNLVFSRRAGRKGSHIYMRCDEFKHAWDAIRVKAGVAHANYTWHDYRRSWNRYATERGIPTPYRATFLGHRIEVNEDNYETAMGYEFMRAKMGRSMAESAADLDRTVRDLFEVPRKQAQ